MYKKKPEKKNKFETFKLLIDKKDYKTANYIKQRSTIQKLKVI